MAIPGNLNETVPFLGREAPALAGAGPRPQIILVGMRIRWAGRNWRVERINQYPGHGPLLALSELEDDSFELICAAGCDGPFEVLPE